jgi:hypothetical protein
MLPLSPPLTACEAPHDTFHIAFELQCQQLPMTLHQATNSCHPHHRSSVPRPEKSLHRGTSPEHRAIPTSFTASRLLGDGHLRPRTAPALTSPSSAPMPRSSPTQPMTASTTCLSLRRRSPPPELLPPPWTCYPGEHLFSLVP